MAVAALPDPEPDDGDVIRIDLNALTIGELEEAEDLTGRNVTLELSRGAPSAKTLSTLLFLTMRRADPSVTLEEARRMPLSRIRIDSAASPKGNGD